MLRAAVRVTVRADEAQRVVVRAQEAQRPLLQRERLAPHADERAHVPAQREVPPRLVPRHRAAVEGHRARLDLREAHLRAVVDAGHAHVAHQQREDAAQLHLVVPEARQGARDVVRVEQVELVERHLRRQHVVRVPHEVHHLVQGHRRFEAEVVLAREPLHQGQPEPVVVHDAVLALAGQRGLRVEEALPEHVRVLPLGARGLLEAAVELQVALVRAAHADLLRHVEAPARHAAPQPVPHDGVLTREELVHGRLGRVVDLREGRHVEERRVRRASVRDLAEGEHLPLGRRGVAQGLLEEGVLAARVVEHAVEHHPDAVRLRGAHHLLEALLPAEVRVHRAVVGDVVTVRGGTHEDRREPQRVRAELRDVRHRLRDALQVPAVVRVDVQLPRGRHVPVDVHDRPAGVLVLARADVVGGVAVAEAVREDLVEDALPRPLRRAVARDVVEPVAVGAARVVQARHREVQVVAVQHQLPAVVHLAAQDGQVVLEPAALPVERLDLSRRVAADLAVLQQLEQHLRDVQGRLEAQAHRLADVQAESLRERGRVVVPGGQVGKDDVHGFLREKRARLRGGGGRALDGQALPSRFLGVRPQPRFKPFGWRLSTGAEHVYSKNDPRSCGGGVRSRQEHMVRRGRTRGVVHRKRPYVSRAFTISTNNFTAPRIEVMTTRASFSLRSLAFRRCSRLRGVLGLSGIQESSFAPRSSRSFGAVPFRVRYGLAVPACHASRPCPDIGSVSI